MENILNILEKDPLYPSRIASSLDQYFDFRPHLDRYDAARKARAWIMMNREVVNAIMDIIREYAANRKYKVAGI